MADAGGAAGRVAADDQAQAGRLFELPKPRGRAIRKPDKSGYVTPGFGVLPGVTTILGATSEGKHRLEQWLKRPDAAAIGEAARNRGTWLHTQTEEWLTAHSGGASSLPTATGVSYEEKTHSASSFAFGGYWRNMKPWLEKHWDQLVALEQPIYHPSRFAGSFDALGYIAYGDEPEALTLCDWKTSQRTRTEDLVEDYKCQLAAYSMGLEYVYGVSPERALLVIARPHGPAPDIWELNASELEAAKSRFKARLQRYYAVAEGDDTGPEGADNTDIAA